MKLEITNKVVNPLFNRTEVSFEIKHDSATPQRGEVVKAIARAMDSDEKLVVVNYIRQPFGMRKCYGKANVYRSEEDMNVEPEHIRERARKALEKVAPKNEEKNEGESPDEKEENKEGQSQAEDAKKE